MIKWTRRSLMGAALATMAAMPAVAQEKITANVIDGYPARALWVQEFTNFFIPEVKDHRLTPGASFVGM
ncbi:hypothetical protein [Tateyamaria pelophila]|uniref:hypothetical protein n=1 Tax=Tateyamaria pelophila TaxID=328415 RepID=UPI001CBBA5C5|nr:hypothetical protein [Tateyamaria pelophila]